METVLAWVKKKSTPFHFVRKLEGKTPSSLWTHEDSKTVPCPGKKGNIIGADGQVKLRLTIV